jgi:hypothetical protein
MALPKFELEIETKLRLSQADAARENDTVFASDPNYRRRFSDATGLWILDDSFVTDEHLKERLLPGELPQGIASHEQLLHNYSWHDIRQHYARVWLKRHGKPFQEAP